MKGPYLGTVEGGRYGRLGDVHRKDPCVVIKMSEWRVPIFTEGGQ